jgi:hypothetical protein
MASLIDRLLASIETLDGNVDAAGFARADWANRGPRSGQPPDRLIHREI